MTEPLDIMVRLTETELAQVHSLMGKILKAIAKKPREAWGLSMPFLGGDVLRFKVSPLYTKAQSGIVIRDI